MHLISVIIPAYNAGEFIAETLNSLNNQIFEDFEVIVINDGSSDNTSSVVRECVEKFNFDIRLIEQENLGVSVARNNGIDIALGQYLTFIDSDDLIHPLFLKLLYDNLIKYKTDTVLCDFTKDIDVMEDSLKEYKGEIDIISQLDLFSFFVDGSKQCVFTCFIYSRKIINENFIRFSEKIKYGEDIEFIYKYISHTSDCVLIEQPLYFYRCNPSSVLSNVCWEMTHSLLAINSIVTYLECLNNPYAAKFKKYAYSRELCYILRAFAKAGEWMMYKRVCTQFNVKKQMRNLINFPIIRTRASAILIMLSPRLFYYFIKMSKL